MTNEKRRIGQAALLCVLLEIVALVEVLTRQPYGLIAAIMTASIGCFGYGILLALKTKG